MPFLGAAPESRLGIGDRALSPIGEVNSAMPSHRAAMLHPVSEPATRPNGAAWKPAG